MIFWAAGIATAFAVLDKKNSRQWQKIGETCLLLGLGGCWF